MASLAEVIDQQLRQLLGSSATWLIDLGDRHLAIWIESTQVDLDRLTRWGTLLRQKWQGGSLLLFVAEPYQAFPYWWKSWSAPAVGASITQLGEGGSRDRFIVCGLGSLGNFVSKSASLCR